MARALKENDAARNWTFLSHAEAFREAEYLEKADVIINCAYHPDLRSGLYSPEKDIDLLLARRIENIDVHYIMLSSRAVYGKAPDNLLLSENMLPRPESFYARNKYKTEQALQEVLRDRLTILRLANIFGYEPGRKSFFGQMIDGLKTNETISFDIAPDSRRDFLPVYHAADYIVQIALNPRAGVYNIGSGIGLQAHEIADWLIEACGYGKVLYSGQSYKGQFIFDIDKAREVFDLKALNILDVRNAVRDIASKIN